MSHAEGNRQDLNFERDTALLSGKLVTDALPRRSAVGEYYSDDERGRRNNECSDSESALSLLHLGRPTRMKQKSASTMLDTLLSPTIVAALHAMKSCVAALGNPSEEPFQSELLTEEQVQWRWL